VSEYLSEEEQVARMKSWWDENGTTLVVSVVVAVAAGLGWNWYGSYQTDQTQAASSTYVTYAEADEAGRTAAVSELAEQFPGSAYHVLALFGEAQRAADAGDLDAAETHLSVVLERADDELLVDLAKVRLAKVQQAQDRSTEALTTLASISSEGYRAWGLEAKGDIHVSRGELQLAHEAYSAALDSLGEGESRPLLEMKMHNVAPADGEYVQFSNTLTEALEAAQETLETADVVEAEAAAAVEEEAEEVAEEEVREELENAAEQASPEAVSTDE
jgi:predicted negative regulator of RcsB-dependent stress response